MNMIWAQFVFTASASFLPLQKMPVFFQWKGTNHVWESKAIKNGCIVNLRKWYAARINVRLNQWCLNNFVVAVWTDTNVVLVWVYIMFGCCYVFCAERSFCVNGPFPCVFMSCRMEPKIYSADAASRQVAPIYLQNSNSQFIAIHMYI